MNILDSPHLFRFRPLAGLEEDEMMQQQETCRGFPALQ
jgi:hypothetical protein